MRVRQIGAILFLVAALVGCRPQGDGSLEVWITAWVDALTAELVGVQVEE